MGAAVMDPRNLWGEMEMLILEVVSHGPGYGYEIAQTVGTRSNGFFELKEGSLYPALHRLEEQKLLSSYWEPVEGRRRKYYRITASGRKQLDTRKSAWRAFSQGIEGILGMDPKLQVLNTN